MKDKTDIILYAIYVCCYHGGQNYMVLAFQPLLKEIGELKCWFEENKYNGLDTDVKRELSCTNLKGNFIK